jgi:threonine/homoserine/homoserine lactone efflux protein
VITHFAAFLGISILVIVTPGQDTALTIRNTLLGKRRAGIATAAGVSTGQLTWTIATSAGLAALLTTSAPIFTAVRLAGAAYLIFLGLQALHSAVFSRSPSPLSGSRDSASPLAGSRDSPSPLAGSRDSPSPLAGEGRGGGYYFQGLLSNLGNPKMVVFFSSLLPQFVTPGPVAFAGLVLLGLVFCCMTFIWLSGYAVVVDRVGDVLRRDRIRRAMEATTGLVLVGLGLRIATNPR